MHEAIGGALAERPESRVRDFFVLLKPRVTSLVVFTALAGMWVAPNFGSLHPFLALVALLCVAAGAGGAGALNMWYERDIDALMHRTRGRPLPAGRMAPDEALTFGVIVSGLAVLTMGLALNWVAALLLAMANLYYFFIYTVWLKRRTPLNIVIGGAAGAFPPLIGWAAVTGDLGLYPLILFAIIFLWTPPHFWALSLFSNADYRRAGIPMLPVIAGETATKNKMLFYTVLLVPVSLLPWVAGFAGAWYGGFALVLGLFFLFAAVRTRAESGTRHARTMFGYSVFYLFALFLAVMADAL